ncbi:S8 family serine peptidase [Massilia sp. H6]|uniref:S8 family serine peptidase n=1 Tax=Massilia sp. H6 TaxID=2970464 RepID=UPI0021686D05|nr:S8 family serine peptidase [Massilia sp. H6]UVW29485.1 S8 family serine peptidase [Massilia sp. H6]
MKTSTPSITLLALAIAALGTTLAPVAVAVPPGEPGLIKGRVLVALREGVTPEAFDKIIDVPGHKRYKLGQSGLYVIDLPGNASERAVLARLSHNPHVKSAEQDRLVKSTLAVNDPYIGSAWHLGKIGASSAWDTAQGAGVTIAILDSGIDAGHADLAPNLVAGYNVYDSNTNLADVCGHGTAVAGAAAAVNNNGIGVAGIAGRSRIMPVRIAYRQSDGSCYASYSTVARGLTHAADNGARIANISYGGVSNSSSVTSAANYMKSKGGLVFVSSGNTGTDQGYAVNASMIVVGATDSNDNRAGWSSFGRFVSLSAPGSGIWTTQMGGGYGAVNGTSFASPVAAGVAALMMSAAPSLSASQVESLLFSSAVDLGTAGRDNDFGYGRVDAKAAVLAAQAAVQKVDSTAPLAAIAAPLGSSTVSGLVAVDANASDNVGVTRVELQVNGTTVASETSAPYGFSWNSAGVPNGMNNLVVVAYDAAGNAGRSATVAVNVANAAPAPVNSPDTTAPIVRIVNPVPGAVAGNVSVSVSATDNLGAAALSSQLLVDGRVVAKGTGGSLSYNWNTRKAGAGTHTIQATVRDAAGNVGSATVSVTTR